MRKSNTMKVTLLNQEGIKLEFEAKDTFNYRNSEIIHDTDSEAFHYESIVEFSIFSKQPDFIYVILDMFTRHGVQTNMLFEFPADEKQSEGITILFRNVKLKAPKQLELINSSNDLEVPVSLAYEKSFASDAVDKPPAVYFAEKLTSLFE